MPAVSTMSSMSTQVLPEISPMTFMTSAMVRLRAPFVDDGEARVVEPLRERSGALDAADVGRHDDDVLVLLLPRVAEQHRRGVDVVDGDVEEAL